MSSVSIVSITGGVAGGLQDRSAEDIITYIARVSNPKNQANFTTGAKLLEYCIKNGHWSIFEQVSMTIEIKTSRAIAAQILRHRSFSFQEFSQRYSKVTSFIPFQARSQDKKNRQMSVDNLPIETKDWFVNAQNAVWQNSMALYNEALDKGVAKEQARALLPLNTATCLYMTGNVRSWVHYINLREKNGTQIEHAEIALQIKEIFKERFPETSMALGWTDTKEKVKFSVGDDISDIVNM